MTPTRISKIYDFYMSELDAALPEHEELFDIDNLDENPAEVLARGYGMGIGDGENTDRCMEDGAYYYRRSFTIILTRDVTSLYADTATRKDIWKGILEDLHLVLKRLTGSHEIVENVSGRTSVISFKTEYADDSGPRSTVIEGQNYVFIELTVSAEYREPTTGG